MEARLRQALARAEEVARALADPATTADPTRLGTLGREHTRLEPLVRTHQRLVKLRDELAQARELAREADPELAELARTDVERLAPEVEGLDARLRELLLPRDPHDDR